MAVEDELRTMIDGRSGTWGVYARHLDTGETVAIRADEVMPAQSSVKVCVLLAYTKRIRTGDDARGRRVTLRSEDHELGSGVLRYLAPGLLPTLDDLAWLMTVASDNIATRALIRELGGREVVNAEMDALGLPQLRLHDSLQQGARHISRRRRMTSVRSTPTSTSMLGRSCTESTRLTFCPVASLTYTPRSTTASLRRCACTARRVGDHASASTPVGSRRTNAHGFSPLWPKTFPACGSKPMTTDLAPSLTSAKPSTAHGVSKPQSLLALV